MPLTEYQNALIECHELYQEAQSIESAKQKKTEADKEAGAKAGKELLNAALKTRYGELTEEELQKKINKKGGKKGGKGGGGRSPQGGLGGYKSPQGGGGSKGGAKRIPVTEYCAEHESADEDDIIKSNSPPKGYNLVESDDEYYLEKKPMLNFRESIAEEAAEWTKIKKQREKARENECKRELALEEREMSMKEQRQAQEIKKAKADAKQTKALAKVMSALAKKLGADSDDSDSDG